MVPARQATQPDGIDSLESILGLRKSLKILALQKKNPARGQSYPWMTLKNVAIFENFVREICNGPIFIYILNQNKFRNFRAI
jgi:hypothetical protein